MELGHRPRRSTILLQLVVTLSLAAFGLAESPQLAGATPAPWTACTSGLNVTGSPVQPSPNGVILYAVSSPTASDVWAAGEVDPPQGPSLPLVEHWNGSTWSEESFNLPSLFGGEAIRFSRFDAVAAFSPTDAWAGGLLQDKTTGAYLPVLMHWNGSDWAFRQIPGLAGNDNQIFAMTGTGGGDLWLEGDFGSGQLEHSNGAVWSSVPAPISGTGPNDVWDIASANNANGQDGELQHYDGSTWTNIASTFDGDVITSDGVDKAEGVLEYGDAIQVSDPGGSAIPTMSTTPLTWDPSSGRDLMIQAISATPRGALFAVGSLQEPSLTKAIPQGIVYRDCSS